MTKGIDVKRMKYRVDSLEAAEVNLIRRSLGLMPHDEVNPLIGKIQQQIAAQEAAAQAKAQAAKK